MSRKPRIFIDGEHGTTGLGIFQRLTGRQDIDIVSLPVEHRKSIPHRQEALNSVDIVILCLPDDAAREAVSLITNPAVRVIDASTAHRVAPDWVYGFPELTKDQPERIRNARFVANPGCYATGGIALLRPLVESNVLNPEAPYSIFGVSGYTGGGKSLIQIHEETDNPEPFALYALKLRHKHIPEIVRYSCLKSSPIFLPSEGHFPAGMIVTIPLHRGIHYTDAKAISETLREWYAGSSMILVKDKQADGLLERGEYLRADTYADSDLLEIVAFSDEDGEKMLLTARLDNLGKGASGAAVQNMNLMLGL